MAFYSTVIPVYTCNASVCCAKGKLSVFAVKQKLSVWCCAKDTFSVGAVQNANFKCDMQKEISNFQLHQSLMCGRAIQT